MRYDHQPRFECEGAALHCCFACTAGSATVRENAASPAASKADLICTLILKYYSLLQSTHGDNQIGPLKNFYQLVEDALVVVRARLKIFLQYALRFADSLKSQLLVSHHFLPVRRSAL
jgi:hypothetical protein